MHALFASIIIGTSSFSFEGGIDRDLVTKLSDHTEAPIVLLHGAKEPFLPVSMKYEGEKQLRRLLRSKFAMEPSDADTWGFAPKAWPSYLYFKQAFGWTSIKGSSKFSPNIVGNEVKSISSGDGYLTLDEFSSGHEALAMTWHPFFADSRFSVCARDCSVADLLTTVAQALGAKLSKDQRGGWYLGLDPQRYRTRTRAMCAELTPKVKGPVEAIRNADLAYLDVLVSLLSDNQILKLLSGWNGVVSARAGHPLHTAALKRCEAYLAAIDGNPSAASVPAKIKDIDVKADVRTYLRIDGSIGCKYLMSDGAWLDL